MNTVALETFHLGMRYGHTWALQDCTWSLPSGKVAGLVGPNGAGKTTLLHLAIGLLTPTTGSVTVLGFSPQAQPGRVLANVGFVGQERPLYRSFSVRDMLHLGRRLNPSWDEALATERLGRLGIPEDRPIGKLSGGQHAQVALVMALAKRPRLLLLDEPVAALDPLARRVFFQTLMDAVAETGLTVLFSSNQVADLQRVCDTLIVLSGGRVQLAGDLEGLLAEHRWIVCPLEGEAEVGKTGQVVQALPGSRSCRFLVRARSCTLPQGWDGQEVSLEDLVLAYLALPAQAQPAFVKPYCALEVSQ